MGLGVEGETSSLQEAEAKASPLQTVLNNRAVQFVLQRKEILAFLLNSLLVLVFLSVFGYGLFIQIFGIPELLGPLYVIAPVSLVLFCFFHSLFGLGWHLGLVYLVLVLTGTLFAEEFGVATGILFGQYSYTDLIPAHLLYVPIEIPFAWYVLLYIGMSVADIIVNGMPHRRRYQPPLERKQTIYKAFTLSLVTAALVVGWDMVLDPMGSTRCSIWVYSNVNGYFDGVPALNFFGWFLTSWIITSMYLVLEFLFPRRFRSDPIRPYHGVLPLFIYACFGLFYVLLSDPSELSMVAVATLIFPLCLALFRLIQSSIFAYWQSLPPSQLIESSDADSYEPF